MSTTRPVVTAELMGRAEFGAVAGRLALFYLVAYAVAPFAGALLWRAGGYDTVLAVVVLLAVAGLACFHAAVRAARAAR